MQKEINDELWGPRYFLMGIIILLGLIGTGLINRLGNHLEVAVPIFFIALLPFVVPYILSYYYPVVAGWILILEVAIPFLFFIVKTISFIINNQIRSLDFFLLPNKLILISFLILLFGFLYSFIGIWMIKIYNREAKKLPEKEAF